ncbi:cysteine rich repeat-containing protein [Bdellovibrio sp. ArHS]|uniref:cysteine rich repeat-containing protein n=1 Tax=Bdellovibrio sp. ArHS TaxID=1569284 RepID=UPI000ADC10AE|nr:cysteine rich repeat-containing protein [Bdellovibrio sp. ArHS]
MKKKILLLALINLLTTGVALAQGDGPCQEDVKKLCPDVQPGDGRIKKCLKDNRENLSQACKEKIIQAMKKKKGVG